MKKIIGLVAGVVCALIATAPAQAATTVVKPSSMSDWVAVGEGAGTAPAGTATFVNGPGTAPAGAGSANLKLTSSTSEGQVLATHVTPSKFSDLTTLSYSTHRSSADSGNNLAVALQFTVDYDQTDASNAFQGRLVFEPYRTSSVPQNTWQTWDATQGKWFATNQTASGNKCAQSAPCTWAQVLTNWPDGGLHLTQPLNVHMKSGGNWPNFNGGFDNLTINGDTWDFEPETACSSVCYVDATSGNNAFGGDTPGSAKKTIQAALNQVSPGGTVNVAAGTYAEDITMSKAGVSLVGAGMDTTTIEGPKGGGIDTVRVSGANSLVEGFTITRAGNTAAEWTNALGVLNNQGMNITGAGTVVRESTIEGNRNGIYIGGSAPLNVSILENVIDNNRTGLHVVNNASGLVVRNNAITNNWTMGVLFRDELAAGVPNPISGITVEDNDISGNWYSQIEARSLYPSGANLDAEGNWLGSADTPSVATGVDSGEEGYATQIPTVFGGTDVPPLAPLTGTVVWNNVLNAENPLDVTPWLCSGDDADAAAGFQPGPDAAQTTFYRDLDGDGLGDPGSTTEACSVPAGYVANDDDTNDDPDSYELSGFGSPIAAGVNSAKAGSNVPVKVRVLDSTGAPVTTDPGLTLNGDAAEWSYKGDGWFQTNWKTSKSLSGPFTLTVDVNSVTDAVTAQFLFR